MTTSTINHTEIIQKVTLLPAETLPALNEFIALLQRQIVLPKKEADQEKLVEGERPKRRRVPGCDEGLIVIGEHFDDPLPEFDI